MRTKHLNQLIADIEVAKFHFNEKSSAVFGKDQAVDLDNVFKLNMLNNLTFELEQAIKVRNMSYLIDLECAKLLCELLNNRGFSFKIPEGDSIQVILDQLLSAKFKLNRGRAAIFIYGVLAYSVNLDPAELAAVQACLDLIENQIEV